VVDSIDLVSTAEQPLPIAETTNPDLRLDWRFLDLRTPRQHLVFRVGDAFERRMRSFLLDRGFTELHTPRLMGAASESEAEVFRVDYFGSSAYLAYLAPRDRVHRPGPGDCLDRVGRGRDGPGGGAARPRHRRGARRPGREIEQVLGVELVVPTTPFPRMTFAEAHQRLLRAGWRPRDRAAMDLDGEGERMLSKLVAGSFGHQFVFVTEYPVSVRPFYHMRRAGDPTVTSSFDLIWDGLEVTTGAQREHRHDVLVAQAAEKGIALEPIGYYVECFRYGCPPHAGLGIGISRLLMKLLNLPSIREATLFYRDPNRLTP
jgi:aspartyl-tRNA synthetase